MSSLSRGIWVKRQSVKHLTSAQVMVSWLVSLSPVSDSVLTAQSLEPALDSVSPSLSVPPLLMLCLHLSLKKLINIKTTTTTTTTARDNRAFSLPHERLQQEAEYLGARKRLHQEVNLLVL